MINAEDSSGWRTNLSDAKSWTEPLDAVAGAENRQVDSAALYDQPGCWGLVSSITQRWGSASWW